jgi:SOS-response transcriptional repressors (RecA-mediated autopeptidases)
MMSHFHDGDFIATKSKSKIPLALTLLPAGEPSEMFDDYELLDLNDLITGGREGYIAYRVTGDSMLENIKPGYIVFVDPYCEPKHGDIIVSRINGKNCVKIFEKNTKGLYLVPANKIYKPVRVTKSDDFQILGVVKGHLAVYGR